MSPNILVDNALTFVMLNCRKLLHVADGKCSGLHRRRTLRWVEVLLCTVTRLKIRKRWPKRRRYPATDYLTD